MTPYASTVQHSLSCEFDHEKKCVVQISQLSEGAAQADTALRQDSWGGGGDQTVT